jgi:hypothetical protein
MRALLRGLPVVLLAVVLLAAGPAWAGEADVVKVEAVGQGDGTWRFIVSVRHGDTGWDHYANKWDVVAPDGAVLGTRVLLHPHESEQPFTRSLGGVNIPAQVTQVTLRAHDSEHGYGGAEVTVDVAR